LKIKYFSILAFSLFRLFGVLILTPQNPALVDVTPHRDDYVAYLNYKYLFTKTFFGQIIVCCSSNQQIQAPHQTIFDVPDDVLTLLQVQITTIIKNDIRLDSNRLQPDENAQRNSQLR